MILDEKNLCESLEVKDAPYISKNCSCAIIVYITMVYKSVEKPKVQFYV